MRKLYDALDRFCGRHPYWGIPNLMRYIIIGTVIFYALNLVAAGGAYSLLAYSTAGVLRGEVWRLEEQLSGLLRLCPSPLSPKPLFFILNSYTTGLSPAVMEYLLTVLVKPRLGGRVSADEIGLPATASGMVLPCGNTAIWEGTA